MSLRRVGADADVVLARELDHVVDGLDIVVDGRVVPFFHERPELRKADHSAARAERAYEVVGLVAPYILEARGQDVREAGRLLRMLDGVGGRLRPDVREVAGDADARHLVDHLAPEAGQSGVAQFRIACTRVVLGVVCQLHDLHAQRREDLQVVEPVLDAGGVLP